MFLKRDFCVGWDARAIQTAIVEIVEVEKKGWFGGELVDGNL